MPAYMHRNNGKEFRLLLILSIVWYHQFCFQVTDCLCLKWYLIVVFICISMIPNGVKHIFMWIGTLTSSLKQCLLKFFTH